MLRRVELRHVEIPLRRTIRHASHVRNSSASLVVQATLDDGTTGHGEGVPRPYVTGETVETAIEALSRYDAARVVGIPGGPEDLVRRLDELILPETEGDPRGMDGNAARCALELALLDAYGRRFGRSLGQMIRLHPAASVLLTESSVPVRYSGAITAEFPHKERISAWKMRLYGFRHVKLKVGLAGRDEAHRLAVIRRILGSRIDLRLDANEAWTADELLDRVRPLLMCHPSALEQPVRHAELSRLADLRPRLGVPVMLDESLCGYPDAVFAAKQGFADLFNVRLSKCGGVFPSLRILDLARRSGLGVQLGCHPGESGILSAAGRHFASNVRALRYVEGSYDRHVLARNLIREDITFRYGGAAPPLGGPGLGVTVDPGALEALTVARREVRFD
jgi:muconate cycloisomerase